MIGDVANVVREVRVRKVSWLNVGVGYIGEEGEGLHMATRFNEFHHFIHLFQNSLYRYFKFKFKIGNEDNQPCLARVTQVIFDMFEGILEIKLSGLKKVTVWLRLNTSDHVIGCVDVDALVFGVTGTFGSSEGLLFSRCL